MRQSSSNVVLVILGTGVELAYGANPIPRKGELVDLESKEDYERAGRVSWRVEDVHYVVMEDTVKVRVLLV